MNRKVLQVACRATFYFGGKAMENKLYNYTKRRQGQIEDQIGILDVVSLFYEVTLDGGKKVDFSNININKTFSTVEHSSLKIYPSTNSWTWMSQVKELPDGTRNPKFTGGMADFLLNVVSNDLSVGRDFKTFPEAFSFLYEMVPDKKKKPYKSRKDYQERNDSSLSRMERFERQNNPFYKMSDEQRHEEYNKMSDELKDWYEYTGDETYSSADNFIPDGENKESPKHLIGLSNALEDKKRKDVFSNIAKNFFNDKTIFPGKEDRHYEPNFYEYLKKNRMINEDILDRMIDSGLLYGTEWRADYISGFTEKGERTISVPVQYVVFVSRDIRGDIENIDQHLCVNDIGKYKDNVMKHYKPSGIKGNGWMINFDENGKMSSTPDLLKARNLYVFEANIDMLSYISNMYEKGLSLTDCTFLTNGGVLKSQCIYDRLDEANYKKVVICFDNDEAGRASGESIGNHIVRENGIPVEYDFAYSGWEEELKKETNISDKYIFNHLKFNDWNEFRCLDMKTRSLMDDLSIKIENIYDRYKYICEHSDEISSELKIREFKNIDKTKSKGIIKYLVGVKGIDYGIVDNMISNDILRQGYDFGVYLSIANTANDRKPDSLFKVNCIFDDADAPAYIDEEVGVPYLMVDYSDGQFKTISESFENKNICCFDDITEMLSYMSVAKQKKLDFTKYIFAFSSEPEKLCSLVKDNQFNQVYSCTKNDIVQNAFKDMNIHYISHVPKNDTWNKFLRDNKKERGTKSKNYNEYKKKAVSKAKEGTETRNIRKTNLCLG